MLAAVLAAGNGAALSHRCALEGWGALPPADSGRHVTRRHGVRDRDGIHFHASHLGPADLAALARIPLTAPPRSLLDFAAGGDDAELEVATNELRAFELLRDDDLNQLRARTPGHHGWAALNRLLESEREPDFSRREAERRLQRLVGEARLPEPRRNVKVHGYEVDLYWPERGVVVEVDSYAFHGNRRAFERDRRKQTDLIDLGFEVLRFTWRQIVHERVWTAARIAGRLAARGRPRP